MPGRVQRGMRRPHLKVDPGPHPLPHGELRKRTSLGGNHDDQPGLPNRHDLHVRHPPPVGGLPTTLRMEQTLLYGRPRRTAPLADRDHARVDLLQVGVVEIRALLGADP